MTERGLGRRSALAALASGVALPVLAACSDGGGKKHKDKAAGAVGSASTSAGIQAEAGAAGNGGLNVLMIVRHAEKPTGSGALAGDLPTPIS